MSISNLDSKLTENLEAVKVRKKRAKPLPQGRPRTTPLPEKLGVKVEASTPRGKQTRESRGVRKEVSTSVRNKIRYPFDFYEDQIEKLREKRRQSFIIRRRFSMSKHVRKALDDYFSKKGW